MGQSSSKWPLAYKDVNKDVPLEEHLARTARLALVLFEEDLGVLGKRVGRLLELEPEDLKNALLLSALLHDVGKASRYYLEAYCEERGCKFVAHEIVSAVIVLNAARRAGDSKAVRLLSIVAKTVARHHAAMECRHPRDLLERFGQRECTDRLRILRDAIAKLDANDIRAAVEKPLREFGHLEHVVSIELLEDAVGYIKSQASGEAGIQFVSSLARELALKPPGRDGEAESALVASLSGMLMVADNLVAGFCEKRSGDAPAYSEHWRWELWRRIERGESGVREFCQSLLEECESCV